MARPWRALRIDDAGVLGLARADGPVDVDIDGRRIWTFWSRRDTEAVGIPVSSSRWPLRRAAWPDSLKLHLNGTGRITLRDTGSREVLLDREVTLGNGQGSLDIRNRQGVELGVDKSGRLVPTFATRSSADIAALMDATEAVIAALRSAGVEPFLAYGTLLGAVREGAVIGHDSDADLGYVSRHQHPVDVALESFRIQRHLQEQGWEISRYSGGAFKIFVTEADVTRGLDVFGGFFDAGRLHLMGEIGTPFEEDWIRPLGTAMLEGRELPVPAVPERLLEAMYGPSWRTPDPAYQFTTPRRTIRAFNDWFRGLQPGVRHWDRRAAILSSRPMESEPTKLGRRVAQMAERRNAEVIDVGAGRGIDSVWLARRGIPVLAYDYVPRMLEPAAAVAAAEGLPLEVRRLSLTELRSTLAEGARLARAPRRRPRRVVMVRHVLDATTTLGAESLARLCGMALRKGDRLISDSYLPESEGEMPEWFTDNVDLEEFAERLRGVGHAAKVELERFEHPDGRVTGRVVASW